MIDQRIIGKESQIIKRVRNVKKILDIILCIVIVPILLINITMFVKKIANPKETPDFLGYKFFVVLTGSMEDTLNIGDFIVTKKIQENELQEQDIITFIEGQTPITHRIIKVEKKNGKMQYITKGDNNNVEDSTPVTINNIEGKYLTKISKIGKFINFLQTPTGLVILIAIPVIMGLTTFKINNYAEQKRMQRKIKRLRYEEERDESEEN